MSALKGHPKGLYLIFATSTAERFSYYGMRAIFILFLTQALLFDKEAAASIYGSYTGLVYLRWEQRATLRDSSISFV